MPTATFRSIGSGEEGCIFRYQLGGERFAVKIFKNRPSAAEIARFERISAALLAKDPTQRYFLVGRQIRSQPRAAFGRMFDLDSCELTTGDEVFYTTLPEATPYERGGIAHLQEGLTLLHSPVGERMAHGDIKRDNIMVWRGNPVFIDFGLARFAEEYAEVNPDRDNVMFRQNVSAAPPEAPLRKRRRARDEEDE